MDTGSSESIVRLPEVCKRVGLGRTSIYNYMRCGEFPPSVRIAGTRIVGWRASEVDQFIASRPSTQVLM